MKNFRMSLAVLFLLSLAACTSAPTEQAAEVDESNVSSATEPATESVTDEIDSGNAGVDEIAELTNMQLATGIFLLEDTDDAITAEQAAELLPFWQAAQSLSASETITAEEFQAVFSQIAEMLTPEQISLITSTETTPELMTQLSEQYGLSFGAGAGGFDPENISPEQQATAEALRESGGVGGGGGNVGGGGGPGGGGPGGGGPGGDISALPEAQQTQIASRTGGRNGGFGGLPTAFYEAIIELLETKIQ